MIAYLRFAFKLSQGDLLDLPTWVYDEHFDIDGPATGSPTKDEMPTTAPADVLVIDHIEHPDQN